MLCERFLLTKTFSCLYFQVLAEKLPELLDFPKDLVSLEAATKVYIYIFFYSASKKHLNSLCAFGDNLSEKIP